MPHSRRRIGGPGRASLTCGNIIHPRCWPQVQFSRAERQVGDVLSERSAIGRRLPATYVLGTLLLSWVALFNRYPLLYPDSAAYLDVLVHHHNLPDRPLHSSL